jgi:hypothetical protein
MPICLFRLQIKGSKLEKSLREIMNELREKKLLFKPTFYLSDEFGCVEDTTSIGIPFFMVDLELEHLNRLFGSEKTQFLNHHQIKALLRHECGHAFFYAYGVSKTPSARKLFGDFSIKRTSLKNIDPNSPDYTDYLASWDAASPGYSQTHPEEDFADTFGAWLDPLEKKNSYDGKALKKIQLIETLARKYTGKKPKRLDEELHKPYYDIKETLANFFQRKFGTFDLEYYHQNATGFLDQHLRKAFSMNLVLNRKRSSAAQFLERNRKWLLRQCRKQVKNPSWLDHIIQKAIERSKALHLVIPGENSRKARNIFRPLLILMTTLLEENRRLD